MDELSKTRLKACWAHETGQRWREALLPEERRYVAGLDRDYGCGVPDACRAAVTREKVLALLAAGGHHQRDGTQKSSPAGA
ncbi:MAG: hypothetical protein NC489_39095, partial [Ruminococcus flavefaciens]|nr:hypothetical protein [Ruminococcus flavefaciens]